MGITVNLLATSSGRRPKISGEMGFLSGTAYGTPKTAACAWAKSSSDTQPIAEIIDSLDSCLLLVSLLIKSICLAEIRPFDRSTSSRFVALPGSVLGILIFANWAEFAILFGQIV